MTTAVKTLALANLNTALADLLPASTSNSGFPFLCSIIDNTLIIDENYPLSLPTISESYQFPSRAEVDAVELVVFSNISTQQLTRLLTQCDLSLIALNAINTRNNVTSYRFAITTADLSKAKQKLVTFNLNEQLESVLIKNAPSLSEPGLVLMDMDSTTIKIECIDELAKLAGVGDQVAEVTELAMQGKLDFTQSLYERVNTLAGASVNILEEVKKNLPLMEGLELLVSTLQQHQWRVAIASGGFTYFADHLKEDLKLDAAVANTLEIKDDQLTGRVLGQVVDANVKAETLNALAQEYQIPASQTVAMGDGANDLVMMNEAALGVAFHAKQLVVDKADVGINFKGLDYLIHWLK